MSERLTSRSPDLLRLREEGYEVEVHDGALLVHHVPYLNGAGQVLFGTMISALTLIGDATTRPSDHVVWFRGEAPCGTDLQPLRKIINAEQQHEVVPGVTANFMFSSKPLEGYPDYYEKMTTYAAILAGPAQTVDTTATATTFGGVLEHETDSIFEYQDNASTRAGIASVTAKLQSNAVAIVGLGGTGAYVLDFVAKTPVREVHLFDGDAFQQHNAFRAPGAPTIDLLRAEPRKVDYMRDTYAAMHRGIVAHDQYVDASNVAELKDMDFVFLTLDDGPTRRLIVARLEEWSVPFIDTGIGLYEENGMIGGVVRATTSTPAKRDHVHTRHRIPFHAAGPDGAYGQNIQIAELNAFNAALAVMRWKKHLSFYLDLEHEHHSLFTIDGNHMINEDAA